jgi:biopolymer transport protein ExbD
MALSAPGLPSVSRKRSVGTHLSEINVTPFVDVMLVLLVIFMVTAPMMQSGIGVNLPQAETDSKPAEEGLTLTVTKDQYVHIGESTININLLERRLVSDDRVRAGTEALGELRAELHLDRRIVQAERLQVCVRHDELDTVESRCGPCD